MIEPLSAATIEVARSKLDARGAVCLPTPVPLPYVVAGDSARVVNSAKHRPAAQPAGMVVAGAELLDGVVDLDDETLAYACWLSTEHRFNVLLPVRDAVPDWAAGAVADGFVAVTLAWLRELRPLFDGRQRLYLSSANTTGNREAVTAAAAAAQFGAGMLVVDGDPLREQNQPSGSATILRVRRRCTIEVVRNGIQHALRIEPTAALLAGWREGVRR